MQVRTPRASRRSIRRVAALTAAYALETTIKLPKWTKQTDSCDEGRTEWARFLAKLTEHENGHDTAVQKPLDAAKPKTMFMSAAFVDCDKDKARQQAEAAEAVRMKELDTELDLLDPESLRTALQNKLNSAIKQIDKGRGVPTVRRALG